MAPRIPSDPRFTPRAVPGDDVVAYVEARFRGVYDPAANGRWPCQGEVVVDLPIARVRPYLQDGTVDPIGPDRRRLVTGAWSWAGLAASIARLDADIEVIGPPELADAFADLARRAARAAASGQSTPSGP